LIIKNSGREIYLSIYWFLGRILDIEKYELKYWHFKYLGVEE